MIRSIGIPLGWGFAEATVFFVVPDVAVGLIALFTPRRAAIAGVAAIAGGVGGSIFLRAAIQRGWNPKPLFLALPGITPADLDWARSAVALNPIQAYLAAAIRGTPVKVLTAEATHLGIATRRLVQLVVLNRAPRIGVVAAVMGVVGLRGRPVVTRWRGAIAFAYVAGWVAFYAWFLSGRRA